MAGGFGDSHASACTYQRMMDACQAPVDSKSSNSHLDHTTIKYYILCLLFKTPPLKLAKDQRNRRSRCAGPGP